jgi:hypothetical protein
MSESLNQPQSDKRLAHSKKHADVAIMLALAAGASAPAAAEKAGVSERTVYRRLQDPDFQRAVLKAREKLLDEAIGHIAQASVTAVQTLSTLCSADSESVRLGASRTLMDLTMRVRKQMEISAKIGSTYYSAKASR